MLTNTRSPGNVLNFPSSQKISFNFSSRTVLHGADSSLRPVIPSFKTQFVFFSLRKSMCENIYPYIRHKMSKSSSLASLDMLVNSTTSDMCFLFVLCSNLSLTCGLACENKAFRVDFKAQLHTVYISVSMFRNTRQEQDIFLYSKRYRQAHGVYPAPCSVSTSGYFLRN